MSRLDDILAGRNLEAPYLLKIDIDGHEMARPARRHRNPKKSSVVIIEAVHSTLPERLGYVLNAGFRLFRSGRALLLHKVFWQADAVFLRNDLFKAHFTDLGVGAVKPGMYEAFR